MTTTTAQISVHKVEDHAGFGVCQECGREGLRWVVYLSDGSRVGGECAKKILGWKPTAKSHNWVTGLHATTERQISSTQFAALWSNERGTVGAISINGVCKQFGPFDWCAQSFEKYV